MKKTGAPKKNRQPQSDLRTAAPTHPLMSREEELRFARICRQGFLDKARVDPLNDEPLSCILGPIILGRAGPFDKELAGKMFVGLLEGGTVEQTKAFFKRVLTLKSKAKDTHSNGFYYYAYSNFIEENGFEPSKKGLKKFILAREETYRPARAVKVTGGKKLV